ncbi:hypothetical protein MKW92_052693 [Papaver armeniacum]|nr:hypothetical protein MKW92_052693 [Papaver armeniacum]
MWNQPYGKTGDLESGAARPLYPMMLESPELRWAFIRKIYSILSLQLLLTIVIASIVVFVHPVSHFFVSTSPGVALYIVIIVTPLIVLCPLSYYYQKHPVNFILLGIFTVAIAMAIGLTCAFTKGNIILEAAILTAVVVVSLTMYTFWAAKRGYDFNFLGPFLFGSIMVLMVFSIIQYSRGYIVYDTDNPIKRYSYDEYIRAFVSLYLDIVNLFLSLLTLFRAADSDS